MTGHLKWQISLAGSLTALAMAIAAVAGIGFGGRAAALANCTADTGQDAEEQAFLGLINQYRAQNGLSALSVSTNLSRMASWHGGDMGAKNYFSHTDSLGRSPSTRAIDCGYPAGAGENIAAGTVWSTASAAFNAWKGSAGHNANMLNGSYRQIGIARVYTAGSTYGWYWVTDFGTVNDGTSGGGAAATATATATRTTAAATATPTRTATTATPTRTATATPATSGPAVVSSPAAGATLPGSAATFGWSPVAGALEYFFYAGTSAGANNIAGRSTGTTTSVTVSGLPVSGQAVYVRLWTRFSAGWQYRDIAYTAASSGSQGGQGTTPAAKATMASPQPGSGLGASATFTWNHATGAQQYFFYMGTTAGSNNLVGVNMGIERTVSLSNLPRDGSVLYVRLWTLLPGGWQYADYTYRAGGGQ